MARDSPAKRLTTTPGHSNTFSPILFNSPALESLKHQQLRSLASRSGVSTKGKKGALVRRLKALRSASPSRLLLDEADECDDDDGEAESSEDDQQETIDDAPNEQHMRPLSGADEFGTVAERSRHQKHDGIGKSSSWRSLKSLASRVFGENIRPMPASGSSRSLSSQATTSETECSRSCNVTAMLPGAMPEVRASMESAHSTIDKTCDYRVIDNTMQTNATVDVSFVPRTSFEGDSIALDNVQAWPPGPASPIGVILVSPCRSPLPRLTERIPQSSAIKRRYTDIHSEVDNGNNDEDALTGGGNLENYFTTLRTIRLVPPQPDTPAKSPSPANKATTPGRRIAGIPKRISYIAASPPRFDATVPQLPSFVMAVSSANAITKQPLASLSMPGQLHIAEEATIEGFSVPDSQVGTGTAPLLSCRSAKCLPQHPPSRHLTINADTFVFGSPQAQDAAATRQAFTSSAQKLLGDARQRMLDEMSKRGDESPRAKVSSLIVPTISDLPTYPAGVQPSSDARYLGDHDRNFSKMDSIVNHYAIKRSALPSNDKKRTKIAAPVDTHLTGNNVLPIGTHAINRTCSMQSLAGTVAALTPKAKSTVYASPTQPQDSVDSRRLVARPGRMHGSAKKPNPGQRRLPILAPASPPKPQGAAASIKESLLKKSFTSLRSFASVGSLSSMASRMSQTSTVHPDGGIESALASAPPAPTNVLTSKSTSLNNLNSFARPTAASLSRTTSVGWLRQTSEHGSLAKPPSFSDRSFISSPKNGHPSAQSILSLVEQDKLGLLNQLPSVPSTKPGIPPRTTKTHPSLLIAPSPKKRLSTASQAHRVLGSVKSSTTIAEERHTAARKMRIKQDRPAADGSQNRSIFTRSDSFTTETKLTRTGSSASRGGSFNARPLWR